MDLNISQQPDPVETPIQQSSSPDQKNPFWKNKRILLGVGTIALILSLGLLLDVKFLQTRYKEADLQDFSITPSPIKETPTIIPTEVSTRKNWVIDTTGTNNKYMNIRGYSFLAPKSWNDTYYEDFIRVTSPDYLIQEGERPSQGASISISETKVNTDDVEESFDQEWNRPRGGPPTPSFTVTNVNGIKAIRYKLEYEGSGITTQFIRDKVLYTINIGFWTLNEQNYFTSRESDLIIYNDLVNSFRFDDSS